MRKNKISPITNASKNKVVLYTDKRGNVELRADVEKDTIWATQDQVATIFDTSKQNIGQHIKNIFKTGELRQNSTVKKFFTVAANNKRYWAVFYNLDVIIAVGYRVNSKMATHFRIWATRILRTYLVKGFNLDQRKLSISTEKFDDLKEAIAFMESESRGGPLKAKMTVRISKNLLP
jgi:hypothetical protein